MSAELRVSGASLENLVVLEVSLSLKCISTGFRISGTLSALTVKAELVSH